MFRRKALSLAAALPFCLASCLPIPHRENDTPQIIGRLVVDGVPRSGMPVTLSVVRGDSLCSLVHGRTITGPGGRFAFAPKRSWSLWVFLVLAHKSYDWQVCLGPQQAAAYRASVYTPGDAPTDSLECEITTNQPSAAACRGQYGSRRGVRP